jgi:hypothetical protein
MPMTEPLRVYEYTLTPADALAYETLPRALGGWRFALLAIWLASSGAVLALLPEAWIGPEGGWLFWLVGGLLLCVAAVVAIGVMTLATHRRARRLVPVARLMRVEEWGDHFSIATEGRTSAIAYETINVAIVGTAHLFVVAGPDVLIIPERAFADPSEMRPLARLLNDYDPEPATP